MAKFMVNASYTPEGIKGLLKDGGTGRRAAVETALKELGGKLETMYFALGKHDVVAIMELPDGVAATALALAINASGAVRTQTTPLLTPAEVDQAVRKAVKYRAPGAAGGSGR
jgi:uncharacterized protein with GYD domain